MKKQTMRQSTRAFLSLILVLFLLLTLTLPTLAVGRQEQRDYLYVGGMPFGVRYFTDGVLVVGYCDVETPKGKKNPAREAGLRPGDCIKAAGGKETTGVAALTEAICENGTKPLPLTVRRDGEEVSITVFPVLCKEDGMPRTGLWVRDTGAGLGTVTFIRPDDHTFAGLGHGICDGECGVLVPIARGNVMGVTVTGIVRGSIGAPGELKGRFTEGKEGVLTGNTPCGVYGVLTDPPRGMGERLPIGRRDEVHEGDAVCRTTLGEDGVGEYRVRLSDIHRDAEGNKCFTVTVTDKALLAKTGGIVQGMSGSPIIQDGKLVGAITHVLIGDPTTGYGIFVENMLAHIPMPLKEQTG